MRRSLLTSLALIVLLASLIDPLRGEAQASGVPGTLDQRLTRLEGFLINQFNTTIGLVRESPDERGRSL
jgi:hypothetical protein